MPRQGPLEGCFEFGRQELSIQMVLAFVEEYHAAGPWRVTDDITLDYYGTREGFTCTKA